MVEQFVARAGIEAQVSRCTAVWPGDTLDSTATVAAIREEDGQHFVDQAVSTVNQEVKEVVGGSATARIDP